MPNPLVTQGTLNRLRASVVWASFPELNVTSPFLSREGLRLSLQGESTQYLPTMTGAVTSQEPFLMVELTINLLKTQQIGDLYKQKMEANAALGDGTVRPDVPSGGIGLYQIINCAIKSVRELDFSGDSAVFAVTVGGYYLINSDLFG